MRWTRWKNIVVQILGLASQSLIPSLPLKVETRNLLHISCGFAQGLIGIIAMELDPETGRKIGNGGEDE